MAKIEVIPLPLPHIGSVNAWLLHGAPLTLIDTGPRSEQALAALEQGLGARGISLEDIELVIGTHHHHDHVGLAATIKRRAGAQIAVLDAAADYGTRYLEHVNADRLFSLELMRAHGVPDDLLHTADALWTYIADTAEAFEADVRLIDGDVIRAGDRDLRVISRPGHSATDTLFVDAAARLAVVGDHVLAKISPNTEIYATTGSRSRSRVDYVEGLKRTASMPLDRLLAGHGPCVLTPVEVLSRQLTQHRRRCERILRALEREPATAFDLGAQLWSEATVREQPLLVVWEVLGHLDLLLAAGVAAEYLDDDGRWRYSLARMERHGAGHLAVAS